MHTLILSTDVQWEFFLQGPAYNINALIQSMQGDESSLSIVSQVSLPFLIAGYGTVAAGMVLDIVQVRDRNSSVIFVPQNKYCLSFV